MIKNIVIISDFSYVEGGASNIAIITASELSISYPKVHVYYFCGKGPVDNRLLRDNIYLICTEQKELKDSKLIGLFQGLWNFNSAHLLKKLLDSLEQEKTIIHLHTWTKVLSPSVLQVISSRKNVIMTLHDYFSSCPNGAFYNYKEKVICTKKAGSLECALTNCDRASYIEKIWRFLRHSIQKKYISKINNMVYLSDLSKDVLEKYLNNKTFYKLLNPLIRTDSKRITIEKNHKYAFIGRLDDEKGVLLLAKTIQQSNIEIIFIGDGKLKDKIKEILPNATITGWIKPHEIQDYLEDVKCLIFPSLWYETFGLTVLEAGCYGIPSIVSKESAASELVIENNTGYIFTTLKEYDLIDKIKEVEDLSPSELKKLGVYNHNLFNDSTYSVRTYVKNLHQIYIKVIEDE